MAKIVLAGGSGHLGKLLIAHFLQNGDDVTVLSRSKNLTIHPKVKVVQWDSVALGEWVGALESADALINLCGQSIQCRFTEKNNERLTNSR
ncbi:MAG: NAD-dependent epimerase/dehydratase family protein, partial [Sphingobacterium sp.]